MSKHILCAEPYAFMAEVYESDDEFLVVLSCLNVGTVSWLSEPMKVYRDAWFNGIIQPLRQNSNKCIYLFDRQHVMTT